MPSCARTSGSRRPAPATSSRWCPRATCWVIAPRISTAPWRRSRPCLPPGGSRRRAPTRPCGRRRAWTRSSARPASTGRLSSPPSSRTRPTPPIRMADRGATAGLSRGAFARSPVPAPAIRLRDVTCTFVSPDAPEQRYTAVENVQLTVGAGEFVSVVGPTGCGKSTLLNVAAGLLEPSRGAVEGFGERLVGISRRAGYMFQADSPLPRRTAEANVRAGLQFRGVPPDEARERADAWLRRVGLGGFGDRYPHQMSGGMRNRTSLAQTLVLDPDIILMD